MDKKTDKAITDIKGVAISLMVLAHTCGLPDCMDRLITMFHMPLFFFASGFCFKMKYLDHPVNFMVRRVEKLYIPFVKYGLIMLLLHNVFFNMGIYSEESGYNNYLYGITDFIQRSKSVLMFKYSEQLLAGYWFLPALFFSSIISWISIKYFKNTFLASLFLLVIGYCLGWLFCKGLHTYGLREKFFLGGQFSL